MESKEYYANAIIQRQIRLNAITQRIKDLEAIKDNAIGDINDLAEDFKRNYPEVTNETIHNLVFDYPEYANIYRIAYNYQKHDLKF